MIILYAYGTAMLEMGVQKVKQIHIGFKFQLRVFGGEIVNKASASHFKVKGLNPAPSM